MTLSLAIRRARRAVRKMGGPWLIIPGMPPVAIQALEWREALRSFACGGPFPLRYTVEIAKGVRR